MGNDLQEPQRLLCPIILRLVPENMRDACDLAIMLWLLHLPVSQPLRATGHPAGGREEFGGLQVTEKLMTFSFDDY